MTTITKSQLQQIAPRVRGSKAQKQAHIIDAIMVDINDLFKKFEINTPLRVAHFLAQTCHESDGFTTTEEYASGNAYDTRTDLGNTPEVDGDGAFFKGHGLMQTTGFYNHKAFTAWCRIYYPACPDFTKEPQTLTQFPWALLSAIYYWDSHNLNAYADRDDLRGATKVVNGGYNGLADRRTYLSRAKGVLGVHGLTTSTPTAVLLRLGSRGPDVTELQTRLKVANYRVGAVDGSFGGLTESAVRDYQADQALTIDGLVLVGGSTWNALGQSNADNQVRPQTEARATATGSDLDTSRIVAASDRGSGAGILGGAGVGVITYWEDAKTTISAYAEPETLIMVGLGIICIYMWLQLQKARTARIEDHRRGKTL